VLKQARDIEMRLERASGHSLADGKVLEIGAGQSLIQLTYFNVRAHAVGIDTDAVLNQASLADYVQMWRVNGSLRTLKTIARKALGVDAGIRQELKRQLAVEKLPRPRVLQMDAAAMSFSDESFDAVYSRAVFEHLLDPQAVLREVRRILKPGGALVVLLHLYTSDTGCHDVRIFSGRRAHIPYWAHLRSAHKHLVCENTQLNRLRLTDWRKLFGSELPGSVVQGHNDADQPTRDQLARLRSTGELSSYTDEELLSVTVEAVWVKP
jgi:SAM-dependent methyltransferase